MNVYSLPKRSFTVHFSWGFLTLKNWQMFYCLLSFLGVSGAENPVLPTGSSEEMIIWEMLVGAVSDVVWQLLGMAVHGTPGMLAACWAQTVPGCRMNQLSDRHQYVQGPVVPQTMLCEENWSYKLSCQNLKIIRKQRWDKPLYIENNVQNNIKQKNFYASVQGKLKY